MSKELDWELPGQQPEGIRWRVIHAIIIGTAVVFGGSIIVMAIMATNQGDSLNPQPTVPRVLGEPQIGIVDQLLLDLDMQPYEEHEARLQRLQSWGWVDQDHGIVHEPVERAIDDIVREGGGGGRSRGGSR